MHRRRNDFRTCPYPKCTARLFKNRKGRYVGYCPHHSCSIEGCWSKKDIDKLCNYHRKHFICRVEDCQKLHFDWKTWTRKNKKLPVNPICSAHKCFIPGCKSRAVIPDATPNKISNTPDNPNNTFAEDKVRVVNFSYFNKVFMCEYHKEIICKAEGCTKERKKNKGYCYKHTCRKCGVGTNNMYCDTCKCRRSDCCKLVTRYSKWLRESDKSSKQFITAAASLKKRAPFLDKYVRRMILFETFKRGYCDEHMCKNCGIGSFDAYLGINQYCEICECTVSYCHNLATKGWRALSPWESGDRKVMTAAMTLKKKAPFLDKYVRYMIISKTFERGYCADHYF